MKLFFIGEHGKQKKPSILTYPAAVCLRPCSCSLLPLKPRTKWSCNSKSLGSIFFKEQCTLTVSHCTLHCSIHHWLCLEEGVNVLATAYSYSLRSRASSHSGSWVSSRKYCKLYTLHHHFIFFSYPLGVTWKHCMFVRTSVERTVFAQIGSGMDF